jgi:transcription-repair coupling factor (superfamily II helicase)
MYQIRGRVGRSDKIAYAYLMYEPRKVLTKEAEKRLETIKEYNELGSGYKIAMRDLSIRGAGDILGEEQSGFIESVGIDVYMKILDEEINKREEKEKKEIDPSITVPMVSRTIKTSYVDNDDARIYIHKRIDKLNSIEALNDLEAELIDRFGQIDDDLYSYMYEKLMKYYVEELDIYKIDDKSMAKTFFFTKEASSQLNGESLFMLTADFREIKITQKNQEVRLILDTRGMDKLNQFKLMCSYFSQYLKSLQ